MVLIQLWRKFEQQESDHNKQTEDISRWGGENNRDKHGCQFHRLFINTWNVVQRNWVLSVGTVLSFFSPQWCVKTQKSVGFWELQRGLVRLVEEGQFFFLHFTEAYIIFLLSVKQCLLYRILGVGDGKKIKKKTQRVRNKKLVVPNATMWTPPHCHHLVEMQVFRQSGPLKQRPNGNLAESRASGWAFSERMALVKCFVGVSFRERWLLEKNKTHTRTQQQFQVQISLFTRSRRVQLQGRTLGLEHQHP